MPLFTRITLNPVNPDVRKVLRSPEAIHAVVSAATSGSSRPLWRLDGDRLYIVSDQLDTDRLEARADHQHARLPAVPRQDTER